MFDIVLRIAWESWSVVSQMAPYLLFGFLVAGVLSVCISPELVERHLGGRGFGPVVKAAALGVPLPLCSCGVIPVAASFRRHGASRAATTSFLLSTPQTGVDSIVVTYALLGTVIAVFRPIVALITGLLGGLLILLFGETEAKYDDPSREANARNCQEACCVGKDRQGVVRRAITFGFVVLPRDIGWALLVGVVVAGVINALVPPNALHAYLGGGIVSIVAMMALGIPLYVCASASVPIAAGLIHIGASPGAALAFLISGPATNAATIATTWKFLGGRATVLYLVTIALSAIGSGLALDWFAPVLSVAMSPAAHHVHEAMGVSWLSTFWAILLFLVVACSYLIRPSAKPHEATTASPDAATHGDNPPFATGDCPATERLELAITGMTCDHCAAAVTRALTECSGVISAKVDRAAGFATVSGNGLDSAALLDAVAQLGYTAEIIRS